MTDGREMHWDLIRAALASVANTVLIPLQDVLGLGSDARMNLPGRQAGNWGFRFTWEQLTPHVTARLREVLDGTTTLIVAHRPSTVALPDRVAVLADGRIQDVATNPERLARRAWYPHLIPSRPARHA